MHAVLITAYKDYPALERLVKQFDRQFFVLFIHIDARSDMDDTQMIRLRDLGCHVSKKYKIRWGEIYHLYALLSLLRQALVLDEIDYVHLISGQDYPLVGSKNFDLKCDGQIFMSATILSETPDYIQDRYRFYNIFYFLQGGWRIFNPLYRVLDKVSLRVQRILRLRRRRIGPFDTIYKGIIWMSFPSEAGRRVLHDEVAKDFLKAARTTYLPEEIYLQTYFLNSDLRVLVENDDLRYTDWTPRNGIVPAYLDQTDTELVLNSGALFARKVNSVISADLLDRIDASIASN